MMAKTYIEQIPKYQMHPIIQEAYNQVLNWFNSTQEFNGYNNLSYQDDGKRVLERKNPVDAAFNFYLYFSTHYFKVLHSLHSDQIIGFDRLASWLRYNPFLTVIDVGCGDGAGTVATIASLLNLRSSGQLDARPIQINCLGIDPNPNGLLIYNRMLSEVIKASSKFGLEVKINPIRKKISDAAGTTIERMICYKRKWLQPSLSHAILIMSNLTDILVSEHLREDENNKEYERLGLFLSEPFGESVSGFVCQTIDAVPIDHLHIFSIDTKPENIQPSIKEMVKNICIRTVEKGHCFEFDNVLVKNLKLRNPDHSYYRNSRINPDYILKDFLVFSGHIHNHDINADESWKKIIDPKNLELAWARARNSLIRESYNDEIELRLYEQNLDANLSRLQKELQNYSIHYGFFNQILQYKFPKNSEKDRPRGLTWLEEEILIAAIIQIIGLTIIRDKPWSYAYRLSSENSVERGSTEYLYESWSKTWRQYLSDIREYANKYPSGVIFKTDIQSYYTHIIQDQLQKITSNELQTSKRIEWLLQLLINKEIPDHDPGQGLIQGSIGSGFLANLYLSSIDNLFPPNDAKNRRLFRYMDDMVVVIPDKVDEDSTIACINEQLQKLNLNPNIEKTNTIQVKEFLSTFFLDDLLDELNNRYENLLDPLWWMNDSLRETFKRSSSIEKCWWTNISRYRACLTETGFYFSDSQISREISKKIILNFPDEPVLEFPDLPESGTILLAIEWAKKLRELNPIWWRDIEKIRNDLETLFLKNYGSLSENIDKENQFEIDKSGRQLRFAINRIGALGFQAIHKQLTNLLCNNSWILRYSSFFLESLARQGYIDDIWSVFDFHNKRTEGNSVYMSAIAIRALRFVPQVDVVDWEKINKFMFIGDETIRLMASETWLMLSSKSDSIPYYSETLVNVKNILLDDNHISRRLLKNYLLLLGKLDSSLLQSFFDTNQNSDPLLDQAFRVAKDGVNPDIFRNVEPDVIRHKYYSAMYKHFDDRSDGSM